MPSVRELYQTFRDEHEIRLHTNPVTGKVSPSVTSIIGFDQDFYVSESDLLQYAAQGSIIDLRARYLINNSEWLPAAKVVGTTKHMLVLAEGSLGLSEDAGDFPAFLQKYPVSDMITMSRLFHKDDLYSGELDFTGVPLFKGTEQVSTVFDIKRTASKESNGMQLAAYCKLLGFHQGIIVQLNDKTKQGFSKPKVYNREELDKYYEMFLEKRELFRDHYLI